MNPKMKDSYEKNKGNPKFNQFMKDNYNPGDSPALRGKTIRTATQIWKGV
tara:strand:+ start:205 stop:354 length:150 start_codon:yes stop_codon:yes gene_type:complete